MLQIRHGIMKILLVSVVKLHALWNAHYKNSISFPESKQTVYLRHA